MANDGFNIGKLLDVTNPENNKPSPLADIPQKLVKTVNEGSPIDPDFQYLYDNAVIDSNRISEVKMVCEKILQNKSRYDYIQSKTGVPAYLVACLHYRETSLSFDRILHNGEKIIGTGQVSKLVPAGRGPFTSWEQAAIDALHLMGYDKVQNWSKYKALQLAERFNGMGYRKRVGDSGKAEYSPYVWAATSVSDETGKFVADGSFDPEAPERQLGVAAIMLGLNI